ncbi:MAG: signal peptide peptidase SppA [Nitrospinaceae bacterium]
MQPARYFKIVWMQMFLFVLVGLLFLAGCANIYLGPELAAFEEKVISGSGAEKVLLVDIQGIISNKEKRSLTGFPMELGKIEKLRETLARAEEDEDIKAILLRINSPGGTVTASDIMYHELKSFKEKKKIKIYVSIMDVAASGGYYIAVAGDTIAAHPTSLTGSIGVIALKLNLEELFAKVGVGWEVIKSAQKKDFLSPLRPLTDEERKLFQDTIDSFHDRFVNIIAENREGLDLSAVKLLADGRVFTAEEALERKLIDQIGYLEDTLESIEKDLNISDPRVVTYHRPGEYKTNVYSSPNLSLINIDLGLNMDHMVPNFMYLWMP